MDIQLKDLQKKLPISLPATRKLIHSVLKFQKVQEANLSVIFVDAKAIKRLNKKFHHRDYATDVLAFDLKESNLNKKHLFGDIFVSTDAAVRQSKFFKNGLKAELVLYIVHGILHLLGYDDHKPADIKKMRRKESEILKHVEKEIKTIM